MNEIDLKKLALELRRNTFEEFIVQGEAHLGGSFSIIEALIALFNGALDHQDDKFILSKAHASFPLCLLLRERGLNVPIKTHLERNERLGIHATTGSLGHGFPISTGMSFAKKIKNSPGRIFTLISDGECQEGTTWESMLIAKAKKLDNLVLIIDYNKIQAIDFISNVLPLDNLKNKFDTFGWDCVEVDGHESIINLIEIFKIPNPKDQPRAIILHTIKGKGIKEFENKPEWHAKKIRGENIMIGRKALGLK